MVIFDAIFDTLDALWIEHLVYSPLFIGLPVALGLLGRFRIAGSGTRRLVTNRVVKNLMVVVTIIVILALSAVLLGLILQPPPPGIFIMIEAGFLIFGTYMRATAAWQPFCEQCDSWCDHVLSFRLPHEQTDAVIDALAIGDFGDLTWARAETPPSNNHLVGHLRWCGTRVHNGYLTLVSVTPTLRQPVKRSVLVNAVVSGDSAAALYEEGWLYHHLREIHEESGDTQEEFGGIQEE